MAAKALVWVALLAATGLALASTAAIATAALPRSTTDRPDELFGVQVHVIYALPSDLDDRALDTDGTLPSSVSNFQTWLRGQTGGHGLRLDTYQGEPDISFHRFSETDAELAAYGLNLRDAIEARLRSAGFDAPGKLYSVYYDGSGPHDHCGGGAWPPALPGTVSAVYMRATYGGGFTCYDPALSRNGLQIMDFAILHETFHTLGLVPTCAPHHTQAGHVSDDPTDIMWAGVGSWNPSVLDFGRDDYFNAPVAGCLDLAESAYLEGAVPPPPPPPPAGPPPPPPPIRCRVPRVIGFTVTRAARRIRTRHCAMGQVRKARSGRPGRVISQRPRAGTVGRRGLRVRLVVGRR
jgi:hypothetical protein